MTQFDLESAIARTVEMQQRLNAEIEAQRQAEAQQLEADLIAEFKLPFNEDIVALLPLSVEIVEDEWTFAAGKFEYQGTIFRIWKTYDSSNRHDWKLQAYRDETDSTTVLLGSESIEYWVNDGNQAATNRFLLCLHKFVNAPTPSIPEPKPTPQPKWEPTPEDYVAIATQVFGNLQNAYIHAAMTDGDVANMNNIATEAVSATDDLIVALMNSVVLSRLL